MALVFSLETDRMEHIMSHIINVADLIDRDALNRILLGVQSHGTSYSIVQDGVEIAKVVPVENKKKNGDKVSDELTKKRLEILAKMEEFSKKVAKMWSIDESATEAVANNRR
jgi:hypothetical protein